MAIEAIGKVTHDDYGNILIPKAEAMMAKGPIRMLYVTGREFTGLEPEALWDDSVFGFESSGTISSGSPWLPTMHGCAPRSVCSYPSAKSGCSTCQNLRPRKTGSETQKGSRVTRTIQ
jgi:hypothetical protein